MSDDGERITVEDVCPTVLPDDFLESDIARSFQTFRMPRYGELPGVMLYRDQVISFVEQVFAPLGTLSDDPWLTPSMVNNYVKLGLVAHPKKKQYGREQIAELLVICIFKRFLPISAVRSLFQIQRVTYPVDVSYNYVATELEHALQAVFAKGQNMAEDSASFVTRESLLVRSAVSAFASKAYLVSYLAFSGFAE